MLHDEMAARYTLIVEKVYPSSCISWRKVRISGTEERNVIFCLSFCPNGIATSTHFVKMWGARERPNGWTLNSCILPLMPQKTSDIVCAGDWAGCENMHHLDQLRWTNLNSIQNEAGIWVSAFWTYFLRYLFKTMRSRIRRMSTAFFWIKKILSEENLLWSLFWYHLLLWEGENHLPNFCIISLISAVSFCPSQ